MDNVLALNLPTTHAFQFSSVRLYLHVTTLSEITHHSGHYILQGFMQP